MNLDTITENEATLVNIVNWKIIPIDEITLTIGDLILDIYNLRKGSQWSLKPILRANDAGGQSTVGFIFTGNFIVQQNNYQDMLPALSKMAHAKDFSDFYLQLTKTNQTNTAFMWLSTNGVVPGGTEEKPTEIPIKLKSWTVNWEISQNDLYPLLTINIKGLLSLDAIDMIPSTEEDQHVQLFNQNQYEDINNK